MVDGQNLVSLKRVRKRARHYQAVLQNIRDATGNPRIVFQDQELARTGIAHQIDARDVNVDSARDLNADHLAMEIPARIDQRPWNLPVFEDALAYVDILQ